MAADVSRVSFAANSGAILLCAICSEPRADFADSARELRQDAGDHPQFENRWIRVRIRVHVAVSLRWGARLLPEIGYLFLRWIRAVLRRRI